MLNYWINECLKVFVMFGTAYLLGQWVIRRGIRVNYTRKIFHFVLFFFPLALADAIPYEASILTITIGGLVFLACLGLFAQPLRERSPFLTVAYASFDRPEDRPFTLLWLSTQVLASYVVLVLIVLWLSHYGKSSLIYIAVLVTGIGDGLAEPVGVRFGRHRYSVRALFSDRKYERSVEGSLCVLCSGFLAVTILRGHFSDMQFALALFIIPIAMTLAEAWSPHTWDTPFLYLAGGASVVSVLEISALYA